MQKDIRGAVTLENTVGKARSSRSAKPIYR